LARSFARRPEAVGDLDLGASALFPADRDPRDEELHKLATGLEGFICIRLDL